MGPFLIKEFLKQSKTTQREGICLLQAGFPGTNISKDYYMSSWGQEAEKAEQKVL